MSPAPKPSPVPSADLSPPWGEHPVPSGESRVVELGALTLWLRALPEEIRLAHEPGDWTRAGRPNDDAGGGSGHARAPEGEASEQPSGPEPRVGSERPAPRPEGSPAEKAWIRWPVPETVRGVHLSPAFSTRPVVVEPESSFRLLPRAEARIYVRMPLRAVVRLGGREGPEVIELSSVVLSETWWGDLTEGELCHWMPTSARRRVDPHLFAPHLAVCPLRLRNGSDEELPVERIVVRGEHLGIYEDGGRLWSDEIRVRYRGIEVGSDVKMAGKAPAEAPDARRVVEPRSPRVKGFRARSFARLKGIPGLAGL